MKTLLIAVALVLCSCEPAQQVGPGFTQQALSAYYAPMPGKVMLYVYGASDGSVVGVRGQMRAAIIKTSYDGSGYPHTYDVRILTNSGDYLVDLTGFRDISGVTSDEAPTDTPANGTLHWPAGRDGSTVWVDKP